MAYVNSEDKITWSQVTALYNSLNANKSSSVSGTGGTNRTRFGFANLTVPANQGTVMKPSHISTLSSFVSEMKSNKYLANKGLNGVATPGSQTLASTSFLNTLFNQISTIVNTCAFDNFDSFDSFGDCSCDGFDSFTDCPTCSCDGASFGFNSFSAGFGSNFSFDS